MRQYLDVKRQHRDAIVFFRMGDFYEMFYEDALDGLARARADADVAREGRRRRARFRCAACRSTRLDTYLARLVRKGYRVAICDQVEDPRKAKGIVKREVTRVVSPGTFTDASYLDAREPAFLAAVRRPARPTAAWGLAFLDVSTGEFAAAEFARRRAPRRARRRARRAAAEGAAGAPTASSSTALLRRWRAAARHARRCLDVRVRRARATRSASSSRRRRSPATASKTRRRRVAAAGAIVAYLRDTQRSELAHVRDISLPRRRRRAARSIR